MAGLRLDLLLNPLQKAFPPGAFQFLMPVASQLLWLLDMLSRFPAACQSSLSTERNRQWAADGYEVGAALQEREKSFTPLDSPANLNFADIETLLSSQLQQPSMP